MQNQKSALGLDGNITALLGYIVGIVALVLIFIEKDNKFVRFHALQSVLWWVACWVGFIVLWIVGVILALVFSMINGTLGGLVWGLVGLLCLLLFLAMLGGVIFAAIKAYGGAEFKLPIVGNLAQKWV
jgi:uncharacterized membrane protein